MAYSHSYIVFTFTFTQTCLVDAYINTAIEQLSDEKQETL